MDSAADKEERKREYNRLAQREFRRRRKEHLKSLEQAQKEQSSERAEEIQRLRFQNEELKRENDALRAQIYSTSSTGHLMSNATMDNRQYSLSPSVSGTSLSGTGSPPNLVGPDMLPMGNLSMSASMMTPSLQAYTEHDLSTQSYSLVHSSGIRQNSQSSPEPSGYRSSRPPLGPTFQPMKVEVSALPPSLQRPSIMSQPSWVKVFRVGWYRLAKLTPLGFRL
ncbi:Bgt-20030 [Blumeria graminis f. sp. tritici]|uniref:Bgt-20030 n=1 Tax=Blumeria graminis f. sp. tritici TaxID=62690 RepID=A0A9X9MKA8_BLUGR|nr:Bgt-20030 [Blumeria graminis f. sp. tritici]